MDPCVLVCCSRNQQQKLATERPLAGMRQVYRVPVVKSQPHVVPEQGRHADGEEDGDKEEEDDMIFGRP